VKKSKAGQWADRAKTIEPWFGIIANAAVVFSVLFALHTYSDQKSEAQKQRMREASLQFVAMRNSEFEATSRIVIAAQLKDGRIAIAMGGDEEAKKADSERIIAEVGRDRIDSLAMFYASIQSCIDAKICDKDTIDPIFKGEITLFYCINEKYTLRALADRFRDAGRYDNVAKYFKRLGATCPRGEVVKL
jgi:hypothetical protein